MTEAEKDHYDAVVNSFARGRVVPFFGAGVNLCDRHEGELFKLRKNLPNGGELAGYLVNIGELEDKMQTDVAKDLALVSQYFSIVHDQLKLYDELRSVFNSDYDETSAHRLIAELPVRLREKGYDAIPPLIVTTNYDDVMERALDRAGCPYDLVVYIASGNDEGRFLHRSPDGTEHIINVPNEYSGIPRHFERPVVLKIHGAVDRKYEHRDSYVITEDDYINYLSNPDLSNMIPSHIASKLSNSNILFMGYGLRDWNLRVILHQIWGKQRLRARSWAVKRDANDLDVLFWKKRNVEIIGADLRSYVSGLREIAENYPTAV